MKFIHTVSIIAFLIPSNLLALEQNPDSYLRRTQENGNGANGNGNAFGRRKATLPCVTVLSVIQFVDRHEEDTPLECELQGADLNGSPYRMLKVINLPRGFQKRDLVPSVSTIYSDGAEIDDSTKEFVLPANAKIVVGRKTSKNAVSSNKGSNPSIDTRRLQSTAVRASGTKKVLILRVKATDAETSATPLELADDIFGTVSDAVNLKSQYAACSDNQLIFEKVTDNPLAGEHSVYTVSISNVVAGATDSTIRTAVVNQAVADFGTDLSNVADHVIVCLPSGTTGSWIAYAYVNHWLSVYNDNWCRYPSGQMHEIGHNMGLAHAGETAAYDDQSGMMGYSYGEDEGPLMCFNGAKTWQLGWYSGFHQDLQAGASGFMWTGDLIGFVDKDDASDQDKMIIRIRSEIVGTDIYIHFNRQTGFNAGTVEGGDQVLVATRAEGLNYATSKLEAKLSEGGVYELADFDGDGDFLMIIFNSLDKSVSPWRANVSVQYGGTGPAPTPSSAPVPEPVLTPVPAPTRGPAITSTSIPTRVPTPIPAPLPTPIPAPLPTPIPAPLPVPIICNDNGICEAGENCDSCPRDCRAKQTGNSPYCCVGGICGDRNCNGRQGNDRWICVKGGI